jgi:hypothetical protein
VYFVTSNLSTIVQYALQGKMDLRQLLPSSKVENSPSIVSKNKIPEKTNPNGKKPSGSKTKSKKARSRQ